MVIDLSRCVGCETCMAACYAENNLGVVGKEWVGQGREMYWLRLTRYFDWSGAHSPALFLPMLCQQCDAAPCEPVCPVFAAAHTEEGLNQQVYNRCIGTRYCSNNCPYKVRRFNWRNYDWPEPLTWQLNPDVTPRSRGVMEKCTFCVQRIRDAEYLAKREGRAVQDGEIQPACVQACPANVFTFGDLLNPNSAVSRLAREDPRHFQVLQDLNTKPAVIYLRKVFNDREPEGV
jgi:Fe-S-cluster-containing dehydrogenase component